MTKSKIIKRGILTHRQNEYGDIAVKDGKDLDGKIVHVKGARLTLTCNANGIDCRKACIGFNKSGGYWSPQYDGVYVVARDEQRLRDAIREKEKRAETLKARIQRILAEESLEIDAYTLNLPFVYATEVDAIPDVCNAMFHLNRYVKQPDSRYGMNAIYSAKNRLMEYLYNKGCAIEVYEHIQNRDERKCYACYGDDPDCYRCDGTGIYQEAEDVTYTVFRFDIGGNMYTWHQPKASIRFDYTTTREPSPMPSLDHEKTNLSKIDIDKAVILVNWFLDSE